MDKNDKTRKILSNLQEVRKDIKPNKIPTASTIYTFSKSVAALHKESVNIASNLNKFTHELD